MVKTKDDYPVIEGYIREIIKSLGKGIWINDNTCEIRKGDKVLGKITLKDNEMVSSGKKVEACHKELIERKEYAIKNKITPEKVKGRSLRNIFNNSENYNTIIENPLVFWELEKELKKIGIDEVIVKSKITGGSSVKTKLVLALDCFPDENSSESTENGYPTRLRNILYDNYSTDVKSKENLVIGSSQKWLLPFEGEKTINIKLFEMTIGRYYKERNLIYLTFNPFLLKKTLLVETSFHPIFADLFKEFKRIGVKTVKTEDLRQKMFISAFLVKAREQLRNITNSRLTNEKQISDFERGIKKNIADITHLFEEEEYIKTNIEMGGKNMFVELKKTEQLSFIKKVELGGDFIKLFFITSTIKIHNFMRTEHGKGFGRRTLYLGNIAIKISPRDFIVTNDIKIHNHSHPHASSDDGVPCFGEGEGRNKIYDLLAVNKFSEVARLLWFWIKTYINGGAHVKYPQFYDSILQQGYPMWDEKGNRIEINDDIRIKADEQKKLEKEGNYEENIKKFKNLKIF